MRKTNIFCVFLISVFMFSACGAVKSTKKDKTSSSETTVPKSTIETTQVTTNKKVSSNEAMEIAADYVKEVYEEYDCVIGTVDFSTNGQGTKNTEVKLGDWYISVKGNLKMPDDYGHIHIVDFEARVAVNEETGDANIFKINTE